ncbi:MAG: DUF4259 domain-containing protein [Planctomycetota bacterium]
MGEAEQVDSKGGFGTMGTWGHGPFENDIASDLVHDLADPARCRSAIDELFQELDAPGELLENTAVTGVIAIGAILVGKHDPEEPYLSAKSNIERRLSLANRDRIFETISQAIAGLRSEASNDPLLAKEWDPWINTWTEIVELR